MQARTLFAVETSVAIVGAAALAAIITAVLWPAKGLAAVASAAFAATVVLAGIRATAGKADAGTAKDRAIAVERQTTRLTVWTLAWSAAALFAAYPLAGLRWQHGWQYASGYAVLALAFAVYLRRLHHMPEARPEPDTQPENAPFISIRLAAKLFALSIALAVSWLIASGKLLTTRQDWLANDIFLASATAIFALTLTFLLRTR